MKDVVFYGGDPDLLDLMLQRLLDILIVKITHQFNYGLNVLLYYYTLVDVPKLQLLLYIEIIFVILYLVFDVFIIVVIFKLF